jgi:dihydrofolate reductase
MKHNRKIIVNLATSADGFIARKDGDIEWLDRIPPPKGFYGLVKFARSIDTKLMGRKTYDISLQLGEKFDSNTKYYVFTQHRESVQKQGGVEFVTEPIETFAKKLRESEGKDIWLMGGAEIIAAFLDAGAIDEFIISIVPIFIGEGIPLMTSRYRDIPLNLYVSEQFPDGVVQLHYKVGKTK